MKIWSDSTRDEADEKSFEFFKIIFKLDKISSRREKC